MNISRKQSKGGPMSTLRCPICGEPLQLETMPDTNTSTDFYTGKCTNKHMFEVSIENQTGEIKIQTVYEE